MTPTLTAWVLVIAFYDGNPYHMAQVHAYEYKTKAICMAARENARSQQVGQAECYQKVTK